MGGAVNGGRIYGTFHNMQIGTGNPADAGRAGYPDYLGRSVRSNDGEMDGRERRRPQRVFPNLANSPRPTWGSWLSGRSLCQRYRRPLRKGDARGQSRDGGNDRSTGIGTATLGVWSWTTTGCGRWRRIAALCRLAHESRQLLSAYTVNPATDHEPPIGKPGQRISGIARAGRHRYSQIALRVPKRSQDITPGAAQSLAG